MNILQKLNRNVKCISSNTINRKFEMIKTNVHIYINTHVCPLTREKDTNKPYTFSLC